MNYIKIVLLVAGFACSYAKGINLNQDIPNDPNVSLAEPLPFISDAEKKSEIVIRPVDDLTANISWNLIPENEESIITIYIKAIYNKKYTPFKIDTMKVPRGNNSVIYEFTYNTTYVVALETKGVYSNRNVQIVDQTHGKLLNITFVEENCLGGLFAWPYFPKAESHQLTITNSHGYRDNITTPAGQTSVRLNVTHPGLYEVKVKYTFSYTSKTLHFKTRVGIGREACFTLERALSNTRWESMFVCEIAETEKGCSPKIIMYSRKNFHVFGLSYDNVNKCFLNMTSDSSDVKIPAVKLSNGCIDVGETLNSSYTDLDPR